MTDGRYSIAPPLDAERIISAQLVDHAAALDGEGRPMRDCAVCGRLLGMSLEQQQARLIRNRPVPAGLMTEAEPR